MSVEDWKSLAIWILESYEKAIDGILERLERIVARGDPSFNEKIQFEKLRPSKPYGEVTPEFYARFSKDINEL